MCEEFTITTVKKTHLQGQSHASWWRIAHWLSLDVALGASASATWVGRSWESEPTCAALVALACGALWVYSVDHWMDARAVLNVSPDLISARRAFLIRARPLLVTLAGISVIIGACASSLLPLHTLIFGLSCLALCGVYLKIAQRGKRVPKEALVSIIYALSLSLWPLSELTHASSVTPPLRGLLASCFMGTLAWSNLCLISAHEVGYDRAEGASSIASRLGPERARALGMRGLLISGALWVMWLWVMWLNVAWFSVSGVDQVGVIALDLQDRLWAELWAESLSSGCMIITLTALYRWPRWSARSERYRLGADLIFIYPLLLWI